MIDQIKDLIYGFTVERRFSDCDCPYIVRAEYECFQIELSKNYGFLEWREDIKSIMLKAGLQNVQITFLFVDTQVSSQIINMFTLYTRYTVQKLGCCTFLCLLNKYLIHTKAVYI